MDILEHPAFVAVSKFGGGEKTDSNQNPFFLFPRMKKRMNENENEKKCDDPIIKSEMRE